MNKSWKIAVAFIVVFVAGGAIGWVSTLRYVKPPPPVREPTAPEEFGPNLLRRWMNSKQIPNLTPSQRAQIQAVILDAAEDLRRTNREAAHSSVLILEHMQDEISALLTPDQRVRVSQMVENQRQLWSQWTQAQQRKALKQMEQQQGR